MKTLRVFLLALVAVSLLAASALAVAIIIPTSSDSSHFGNQNNGAPTGGATQPGGATVPGDLNNTFHGNTGGTGFGSGL
jgi:hypothetical protein